MQIRTNEFQQELKEHGNYAFPILISSERLSRYESGSFLWHWHPEIELTLITKGEMLYQINNDTFHLTKGQALFGNSSTLHSAHMYHQKDCEYRSITFDAKLIFGYENSLIHQTYIKPIVQNFALSSLHFDLSTPWHSQIIKIIEDLVRIYEDQYVTYELDLLSLLTDFWKILYRNIKLPDATSIHDKVSYDRIRHILQYIEEHYSSPLTLEMVADSIHLCRSECSRLFKKQMNVSLFDFITQYRIEKSVSYLTHTNLSITEISELVGFRDPNYYTKVFHHRKGCSPTSYRISFSTMGSAKSPLS